MLQAVGIFAVATVGRTPRRLDVDRPPGLGAERTQGGRRVEGPCADLEVVRLQQDAALVGPEPLQDQDKILKGRRRGSDHSDAVQAERQGARTIATGHKTVKKSRRRAFTPGHGRNDNPVSGRSKRRSGRTRPARSCPVPAAVARPFALVAHRSHLALARQAADHREALPDRHRDQDREQDLGERQPKHIALRAVAQLRPGETRAAHARVLPRCRRTAGVCASHGNAVNDPIACRTPLPADVRRGHGIRGVGAEVSRLEPPG